MFRAIAALLFIVLILPLAALVAALVMTALGVSGLLGFIVGLPVFAGLLTAAVMLLAAINDRLNDRDRYQSGRGSKHNHTAHHFLPTGKK